MLSQGRAKKTPLEVTAGGVLRAARAGAGREEWIRIAIDELAMESSIARIGIWLEPAAEEGDRGAIVFSGAVWERNAGNLPPEWRKISAEAPLPREVLNGTSSVEYQLAGSSNVPMLGPLVELQRALWVPIIGHRILSGLILAGTREKQTLLPRAKVERVADELGLLLEIAEERRLARERQEDLTLWRRTQDLLREPDDSKDLLRELAESCTGSSGKGGAGAVFALIGERSNAFPVNTPAAASEVNRLVLRGLSGDPEWAHCLDQGSLENLWRQALETGRVCGAEAERLPLARKISRVVAIPMEFDGAMNAVLVAGLPWPRSSLGVLERLELRALLAAQVLERRNRIARELGEASQLGALLELNAEPVVVVDRRGFITGMSRGARQLIGDAAELRQDTHQVARFAEVFRPREWEEVHGWVNSAFVEETHGQEDPVVACLKNGTALRLRFTANSDGEHCSIILERADELPRARELQEVEAELQQALEWLDEGVVVFDENDRIRAKNARFLQILGLSAAGSSLRTLEDLIRLTTKNASDPEKFAARWKTFAEGAGERMREELAMEWPLPQVIERSTRAIVGENGRKLGRVEVYREMSAQRMFQSRMMQTEKLAAIGQHATGIVHELSNPLTTILVNAQRLASQEGEGMRATLSQNILEESERAAAILRQLLVLSRESLPERRRVSLNDLVDRTMDLQRLALSGSRLRLIVEKQEGLPLIEGDFSQLQQVLMNLLQNAQQALEYSGTGSTIGVRTGFAGGRLTLEVWDDGPGIPGVIQARIFDPFFTTKPPGVGTGLGLAIVLGFVRQHGGTVTLASPPHGGARFVVEFPVPPAAEIQDEEKGSGSAASELPPPVENLALEGMPAGKVPRILVVEDEPTVASLIADVLRDEGMRVDVLLDSREAVQQVERESYDLAVCDLRMPGMDGQRFYRTLVQRQNPLCERVLFVTGDLVAPRTQEFLDHHHLAHVAKPFRMEELSAAVHGMLGKKKVMVAVRTNVKAKEA
jgi:signal transduction histidine kinase/ActR/RegA family two-component response regulator